MRPSTNLLDFAHEQENCQRLILSKAFTFL